MHRFEANEIVSLVGDAPRYDLGASYGPNLVLDDLEPDPEALRELVLGYGTAPGDAQLREIIAEIYGVNAGDVVTTIGGMHALFLLAFILCERGSAAVTIKPNFPPTRAALEAVGAKVAELSLSFDNGYRVDALEIESLLSHNTRAVILTSPQNPSGISIPHDTLGAIYALMERKSPDAFLIVDDTYREATFGTEPAQPSALGLGAKVITTASLSKCHGAPGLRTGWAITRDRALREQLVLAKFNTIVSCPPIEERLAIRALQKHDEILAARRHFLSECLNRTEAWVRENAAFVEWIRPDAGAICCVRLKRDRFDDAGIDGFYDVLAAQGVRVSKGEWFGDERRVFRLGFAHLASTDLDRALSGVATALSQTCAAPAFEHSHANAT